MKFRIDKNIDSNQIEERVPTEYKSLAEASKGVISGNCVLITFPHNRKDVVKSSLVAKALKKLDDFSFETLVVVGGCFSVEAVELLKPYETIFLSLSEFPWTDARHTAIKSGE
jgi:hypothetical protein